MVIFQMILQVILALIFLMSGAGKVKGGTEYEKASKPTVYLLGLCVLLVLLKF